MRISIILAIMLAYGSPAVWRPKDYWLKEGKNTLERKLTAQQNTKIAKNVILFLGDGMGISTQTAARIYRGQQRGVGQSGEQDWLSWEEFPNAALVKTYTTDRQVADSAATITAILSGVKGKQETVGLDDTAEWNKCSTQAGAELENIFDWAFQQGKSTGTVTQTEVNHATPSATYGNICNRYWYNDGRIPDDQKSPDCRDLALQFITNGTGLNVLLGGGYTHFIPGTKQDPFGVPGSRSDGRDLVDEWLHQKAGMKSKHRFVSDRQSLRDTDAKSIDYLFGMFSTNRMEYSLLNKNQPNLLEMATKAIEILKKNEKGFVLLIEGGLIDKAHHAGIAKLALDETVRMDEVVQKTQELMKDQLEETLILVTADHSHVFTIGGYPDRGNGILDENDYLQKAAVWEYQETHGGEDVAVYARGPWAHLLDGLVEQNYLGHVMAHAACLGEYRNAKHCNNGGTTLPPQTTRGTSNRLRPFHTWSALAIAMYAGLMRHF